MPLHFNSVFAGIAVLSNCLLMVSWFPACVVIWERAYQQTSADLIKSCLFTCGILQCRPLSADFIHTLSNASSWIKCKFLYLEKLWIAKDQILLDSIINYRILWVTLLTIIALASGVTVLYYPKFQLPNSPEFQLFDRSHPFEQYELEYKNHFWFKREQRVS